VQMTVQTAVGAAACLRVPTQESPFIPSPVSSTVPSGHPASPSDRTPLGMIQWFLTVMAILTAQAFCLRPNRTRTGRSRTAVAAAVAGLAWVMVFAAGCASTVPSTSQSQPASQTYTITITATCGTVKQMATVTMVVTE
jgi:hypothetical protein